MKTSLRSKSPHKSTLSSLGKCILIFAPVAFALSSCATHTPQTRIQAYPDELKKLPVKHQELIQKGQIDAGMNKSAVYLAWGKADKEIDLYENNKRSTRWEYHTLKPVVRHSFHGGVVFGSGYRYNSCYHPYRSRRYHNNYLGIGTGIHYTKVKSATVLFENEKVKSWQIER